MTEKDSPDISKYFIGYQKQFKEMVAYGRNWGLSTPTAEDLAQAAYIKAVDYVFRNKIPQLDPKILYRARKYLAIDSYRNENRYTKISNYYPDSKQTAPEIILENKEDSQLLNNNMSQLSQLDRQVVAQRYLDEMSFTEIAAAIQKSEGAVRVILCRAMKKLRSMDW